MKKLRKPSKKLSDIFGSVEHKIKVEKKFQKETEEKFQKQLDEKYETGYFACLFKIIDKYFQKYVKGETLQSIVLPEKIKFSDLQQKYGESSEFKGLEEIL